MRRRSRRYVQVEKMVEEAARPRHTGLTEPRKTKGPHSRKHSKARLRDQTLREAASRYTTPEKSPSPVIPMSMDANYRRMLKVMQEKEKKRRRPRAKKKNSGKPWFLYILKCSDNSFYTGITNDLERRLKMHANGRASRYTRTHGPVELLYRELCGSRTEAMVRECAVKALSRKKKEKLVGTAD